MTTVARHPGNLDALDDMFGNCPGAVAEVRSQLGDSGELLDFWFDFALGSRHAVFYRFRLDGIVRTAFAVLDNEKA